MSNNISKSTQPDVRCLLSDLLLEKRDEILDSIIDEKSKIKVNMVITDHTKISDAFLKVMDFEFLEKFFNKSSWKTVISLIENKKMHCRCPVCSEICYEQSIECDMCKFWYHFECAKVNNYLRSGKAKSWLCSRYGFKCLNN